MRTDQPRLTRRRLLGAAGTGLATAAAVGPVAADGREGTTRGGVAPQVPDEERYAEAYRETIDDVVLVTVGGTGDSRGGLGSGFVLEDGGVVTNAHVVADASSVELQFSDEQWRDAAVAGTDLHGDLAVLDVDDLPDGASGLAFAGEEPSIGQEVLALGNPLGLDASVSRGIVSGLDRSLPSPAGFPIPGAIQTDASVNPGNSGGPLVSLEGSVLGVVFAGAGQTIGFAIAAALAERVVPALREEGEYEHAYLGVGVRPVSPRVAEENDLEEATGVLVGRVDPDGPAADVLEPADESTTVDGAPIPVGGDVIVAIDGEEISNQERLSAYLALETSPGDEVEIDVRRDGDRETVDLTLAARPEVRRP